MLSQACNITIDGSVVAPGHLREFFDGLNGIEKFPIKINDQSVISRLKGLCQSGGNSHLNPYRIHQYSKWI